MGLTAGHRPSTGLQLRKILGLMLPIIVAACGLLSPSYPELSIDVPGHVALPPDAEPPRLSVHEAVERARAATRSQVVPSGVGRRLDQSANRTVWIVVFDGGTQRPCGPAPPPGEEGGRCVEGVTGAAIDDQTGSIEQTFEAGWQVISEQ